MALAVLNRVSQQRFSPGKVVVTAGIDEWTTPGTIRATTTEVGM